MNKELSDRFENNKSYLGFINTRWIREIEHSRFLKVQSSE